MGVPRAWHDDPASKECAVARMRHKRERGQLIQGVVGRFADGAFRGDLEGCLTGEPALGPAADGADVLETFSPAGLRAETARRWGIPEPVMAVAGVVFELLDDGRAPDWAVDLVEAVPVGADLSPVVPRLMADLMSDPDEGVRWTLPEGSPQRSAADLVAALYSRQLAGETVGEDEWEAAARAAKDTATAEFAAAHGGDDTAAEFAAHAAASSEPDADTRNSWLAERLLHHVRAA